MYQVGIVTLSDKGAKGERQDLSGPKIQELLPKDKYEVISYTMLPDDREKIRRELIRLSDEVNFHRAILRRKLRWMWQSVMHLGSQKDCVPAACSLQKEQCSEEAFL